MTRTILKCRHWRRASSRGGASTGPEGETKLADVRNSLKVNVAERVRGKVIRNKVGNLENTESHQQKFWIGKALKSFKQ